MYQFLTIQSDPSSAADTLTLLDQCSFELINICGMIQNEGDNADWVQTLSSPTEPDHTLVGRCRGTEHIHYIISVSFLKQQVDLAVKNVSCNRGNNGELNATVLSRYLKMSTFLSLSLLAKLNKF